MSVRKMLEAHGFKDPLETIAEVHASLDPQIAAAATAGDTKTLRELQKLKARCEGDLRRYGRI